MNPAAVLAATPRWAAAYPTAQAGVLVVRGVSNPPEHPGQAALEQRLRERYAGQDRAALRRDPVFQAYAAYYRTYKKTYHVQLQLEAVVFKGQPLPRASALVTAMFMAELEHGLLTAGHDLARVALPATLDAALGGETYVTLRGETATLKAGDMFIADQAGILSAILSGPDQRTRLTPDTRAALFTVYGPPGLPRAAMAAHLDALAANVRAVAPEAEVALKASLPEPEPAPGETPGRP
ncbi:MAG TPA: phenylalanine--tRNA ligase beta subunit-related protein [Longimicrobiales bacterium]